MWSWLTLSLQVVYDFFCATVTISDVASNAYICMEFYCQDRMVFFWICVGVFVIAQICYAVLFTSLYGLKVRYPDNDVPYIVACFLCILPFSQLVPWIVWIGAFKFRWFDALWKFLGLEVRNDAENQKHKTQDRLKNYILTKVHTHAGFTVESIVVSVPFSVIQIIAMLTSGKYPLFNVASLALSIISVASRGLLLSYSIHRPTFVFNFLCFITDLVRVFCVVSWLFFPSHMELKSVPFVLWNTPGSADCVFTYIWWWKESALLLAAFAGGILWFFGGLEDCWISRRAEREEGKWKETFKGFGMCVLLALFGLVIFIPCFLILEALALSLFPLFVFQSFSSVYAQDAVVYRAMFAWISEADFAGRVREINRHYAKLYLESSGFKEKFDWQPQGSYIDNSVMYQHSVRIMRITDEKFCRMEAAKKEMWCVCSQVARKLFRSIRIEVRKCAQNGYIVATVGVIYVCLFVPLLTLSGIYSLIYPMISFFRTPWAAQSLLNHVLSSIVFVLVGGLLLLTPSVVRFYWCSSSLRLGYLTPDERTFEAIKKTYSRKLQHRERANVGRMAVLIANANANKSSEVVNHIVAVLPEITRLAGFTDAFSIDVEKLLGCKAFYEIANAELKPESQLKDTQEPMPTLTTTDTDPVPPDAVIAVDPTHSITRSRSSVLSSAMRSIGIDPQFVLDRFSTPGHILHRISSQYQDQLEFILEGIKAEAAHTGDTPLVHDGMGLIPAALFRQASWREKLQKSSASMHQSQSQSSIRTTLSMPRLRFHTT